MSGASFDEGRAGLRLRLAPSDDQRRALAMGSDESLELVDQGPRTLIFARAGQERELPRGCALVLQAELHAFPMADWLRLIHDAGKSGYLLLEDGEVGKGIFLHRGEVVFATSNQRVDRLGECLLRAGALALEQLREAERRWSPEVRFGKVLVERGYLSPQELWNGVKLQVEEIVRSLFSHTGGRVLFWEGAAQPDNVVRLSLPTRRLVAEGLSRREELLRFVESLEAPGVRFQLRDPQAAAERDGLERLLLERLEGAARFPALCRETGLAPLTAARILQMLCLVGAIAIVREADSAADSAQADIRDRVRSAVLDRVKLLAELVAPLVATEGAAAVRARFGRVIAESAEQQPDLLHGLELGPAVTLDPDVLSERALALPEDPVRAVSEALGELVAYAEFELMNSPHVDDPTPYFEALEPLRASLEL